MIRGYDKDSIEYQCTLNSCWIRYIPLNTVLYYPKSDDERILDNIHLFMKDSCNRKILESLGYSIFDRCDWCGYENKRTIYSHDKRGSLICEKCDVKG